MGKDVIVALDFDSQEKTLAFLDRFTEEKPFVKIGMELFYAEGPSIVREIRARGHKIFLDLKLHDIPNTVKKAMACSSALDVDMVNLHAAGTAAMMTAALEGLTRPDGTRPLLIAVTQLTSTDQERMERELLIDVPMEEVVLHYAENAAAGGAGRRGLLSAGGGQLSTSAAAQSFLHRDPGRPALPDGDAGRPEAGHHPGTRPGSSAPTTSWWAVPSRRRRTPSAAYRRCVRGVRGLMRWDTVLFDLDGTVTDSQEGIVNSRGLCAASALAASCRSRDTLTAFIGPPLHESFPALCGMDEAETERAICEFRDVLRPPAAGRRTSPTTEWRSCLPALRAAGLRLIIATSKPEEFARENFTSILRWRSISTVICGSHPEDRASADKASVVRTALMRAGVTGRAVMVGDRRHDILRARTPTALRPSAYSTATAAARS